MLAKLSEYSYVEKSGIYFLIFGTFVSDRHPDREAEKYEAKCRF
jgi:hypothetical protein